MKVASRLKKRIGKGPVFRPSEFGKGDDRRRIVEEQNTHPVDEAEAANVQADR